MSETKEQNGGATVLGVPLEASERVIAFDKPDYSRDKIVFCILGVVFLVAVVGVVFFVVAFLWERFQPRGAVVTNRRVISIDRKGVPSSTALNDVVDIDAERQQTNAGDGGLVGALVSAAVDAAADHQVGKNPKQDAAYWKRTVAIVLVSQGGARARVPTRRATDLGPFIMRVLSDRAAAEQLPAVPFEA